MFWPSGLVSGLAVRENIWVKSCALTLLLPSVGRVRLPEHVKVIHRSLVYLRRPSWLRPAPRCDTEADRLLEEAKKLLVTLRKRAACLFREIRHIPLEWAHACRLEVDEERTPVRPEHVVGMRLAVE